MIADYYYLAQRQSRLNPGSNYFYNVYGASHEYFNSEWHQAIDACLGDQTSTWNTDSRSFDYTEPNGNTISIPLVLGSPSQRDVLNGATPTFAKAHINANAMPDSAYTLQADNTSSEIMNAGVETGLANLNINTSTILQDFAGIRNLGEVVDTSKGCNISSIPDHAESQYPNFKTQARKYG